MNRVYAVKDLIKIANHLDAIGEYDIADRVDLITLHYLKTAQTSTPTNWSAIRGGATYLAYRARGYDDLQAAILTQEGSMGRKMNDAERASFTRALQQSGGIVQSAAFSLLDPKNIVSILNEEATDSILGFIFDIGGLIPVAGAIFDIGDWVINIFKMIYGGAVGAKQIFNFILSTAGTFPEAGTWIKLGIKRFGRLPAVLWVADQMPF